MKKTSMKKFGYALVVSSILCGCENDGTTISSINFQEIKTYVIDSCEYIGDVRGLRGDFLTHKGNCKFCVERNKRNCQ